MPVIWRAGTTVVRDYNPGQPERPVVFVIPSLINRFDILDLEIDRSFLRWLAAQGFRPLVVDWDSPGEQEKDFDFADYVTQRLVPALHGITPHINAPVHIVGYCMGGLLALALAALEPRLTQSLTLMATPWDFHLGNAKVGTDYLTLAQKMMPQIDAMEQMPVDLIQSFFAALQPFRVMNKFATFADLDLESPRARQFVILEDWLNDGIPLTAAVARGCLFDFYGHNKTMRKQWTVAGHLVDPGQLSVPSYVLVPGKDRIVPPGSALPLAQLLPRVTLHEPMMGHIGLMASHKAPQDVWAPYASWLQQVAHL